MSVSYKGLKLNTQVCTFDDCLITSLVKKLFTHTKGEPVPVQIAIHKKIADVKEDLTHLTANTTELSYNALALLEKVLPDVSFRYVVISKSNKPVLFAYYQLFTLTSSNFNLNNNSGFVKGILKFFVNLKRAKAVVLGNVLRNEMPGYCYDRAILNTDEAVEAVAGIAEKIAAEECATAIILKELPALSPEAQQVLADNRYTMPFEDTVMEMPVNPEWKTFADYTNALSRKYKARASKAVAALQPLEVRVLSTEEVAMYERDIDRLFSATVHQQPFTLTQPQAGYFTELKRMYKDEFEVVGYLLDGRLISFYTAFVGETNYNIYYVGFDYELNNTYQLYFNILFSGLEKAILAGKTTLELGRTSFDAKASLGAQPRQLNYLIKLEYIPDFVVQWFVKYFSSIENNKWKQRNPLK